MLRARKLASPLLTSAVAAVPTSTQSNQPGRRSCDQRGLGRSLGGVLAVGLEEPVLGRSLDPQPGARQAVSGLLDIGLSHHKIDVVTGFRPAVYPKGIATPQCEEDTVGLQG